MNPKWLKVKDEDYENWIRSQPCIICNRKGVDCHHVYHARRNSHLSLPLCRGHHTSYPDSYHVLEAKKFEETHNIDLDKEIIKKLSEYIKVIKDARNIPIQDRASSKAKDDSV